MAAGKNSEFAAVSARLQAMLQKNARGRLSLRENSRGYYVLTGPPNEFTRGRVMWFGAVRTGKAYVSYHLMPVYMYPDLVAGISPELKKHMQGKSCFNFRRVDDKLFKELAKLTDESYKRCKQERLIDK